MKNKLVFANITNSIGELDVLLPLFAKLKEIGSYKFILHLTSIEFIKKFEESIFYQYVARELNIKVIKIDLLPIRNKNKSKAVKMLNRILYAINFLRLLPEYYKSQIIIHDYTSHRLILKPLYLISKIKKSKIYAIPHGLGVQIDTIVIQKADILGDVTMLIFDEETRNFHKKFGYINSVNIGYVKFYPEWIKLIHKFHDLSSKCNKKIVILSRHVHELYMDEEKYKYLLSSFFKLADKLYQNHNILIKLHPREDQDFVMKIAEDCGVKVKTIRDHPSISCIDASLVVSFWTSAILDAAAVGVPAVEYYIEAENFRTAEPLGSVFKKIGFRTASNATELEDLLNKLKNEFNSNIFYKSFYKRVEKNMPNNNKLLKIFS